MAWIARAVLVLEVATAQKWSNLTPAPTVSPAPTEVCEVARTERIQCIALGGRCANEANCTAEGGTFHGRLCGANSGCGCCGAVPTAVPTPAPTVDQDSQRASLM